MEFETFSDRTDNLFGFFNSDHELENFETDDDDLSHLDAAFDALF